MYDSLRIKSSNKTDEPTGASHKHVPLRVLYNGCDVVKISLKGRNIISHIPPQPIPSDSINNPLRCDFTNSKMSFIRKNYIVLFVYTHTVWKTQCCTSSRTTITSKKFYTVPSNCLHLTALRINTSNTIMRTIDN